MTDTAMDAKLLEIVDILLAAPDEFGLNEVCAYVKYDLAITDDREVKRLTLQVVRELLRRGAVVDFDTSVLTVHLPARTPDEIITRIDREWDAIGEMPTLPGEICFFQWTSSAMEAYARS